MDNQIDAIRREISNFRADMLRVEEAVRKPIDEDLDCTKSARRLTAMRTELAALVAAVDPNAS